MQKIKFVSFDYSLSSPAMCMFDGEKYFVCAQSSEKKISCGDNEKFTVQIYPYPDYGTSQQNRYFKLSDGFINVLSKFERESNCNFSIEDYAFGAKGKVFHIAENTQSIKHAIWQETGQELLALPPTAVKKYFSGKGNANKEKMAEAFNEHFGFFMHEFLGSKLDGTACDLVDSVAVNWVAQRMTSGEIPFEDIFKKQNVKNFGELKKLGPFKGLAKAKA